MPETRPEPLTNGSNYRFKITYHLAYGHTLDEMYDAPSMADAVQYAQGKVRVNQTQFSPNPDRDSPFTPYNVEFFTVDDSPAQVAIGINSQVIKITVAHTQEIVNDPNGRSSSSGKWAVY